MKHYLDDLAIFGGSPAFDEKLHVGRPNIGDRQRLLERINDLLDRKWLTNDGPFVQEFERQISEMLGVRHCITVCNATVALEIAIRAAGLIGEVILPSFTFIATAHALQWQEITPVFCDVDPRTHNIDPDRVEQMITPRTTGIIGVHLWGRACDADRLMDIAERRNLKLLFDAAHAFGCSYKGRMIGNFGNAEVFSFHATKFCNSFEGGAVVTNDDELAAKIRLMKNFGFAGYDDVVYIGTNGKMSEVAAAMGMTSLESREDFIANNYRNYKQYRCHLADIPGVSLLTYAENEKHNYHYSILEIDEAASQISRDQLQDVLWAENVLARRYFYPGCHRMEPYRSYFPHANLLLPNTEHLVQRVLALPTGMAVGTDHISKICQIIRLVVAHGPEVRERLSDAAPGDPTSIDHCRTKLTSRRPPLSDKQLKVSVLVTTYNHEKFIAQAIDSILIQKASFDYEIIIIEDYSTDSTREIVIDFQKRHPDKIHLVLSEKNRCDNSNFALAFQTATSQYIALLDGDDYWTSPDKLQRQVNFLDAHPEYAMCFHNVVIFYEGEDSTQWNYNYSDQKETSALEDLWKGNFIAGCSPMIRKGLFDVFPEWYYDAIWADWPLYILNAQYGKIGYINEVMGAYRLHSGGLWSSLSETRKLEGMIQFYEDMNVNLNFRHKDIIQKMVSECYSKLAIEKAKEAASKAHLEWQMTDVDSRQFTHQIQELVYTTLPSEATVIVVGEGGYGLLQLEGRTAWHFPQTQNSGMEKLFAEGAEGSAEAPWVRAGMRYDFRLYAGREHATLLATVEVIRSEMAPPMPLPNRVTLHNEELLTAAPNPIPAEAELDTTAITWRSADDAWSQVFVAEDDGPEKLFAEDADGTADAPWIRAGTTYVFRLYAGKEHTRLLSSIRVTRGEKAFLKATPNPVPAGSGIGTTAITWSTGDTVWGQVYVSEHHGYADYYPANSAEAIAHLEALRAKGADFLLLPNRAFWWLDYYEDFAQHINTHYRCILRDERCIIYQLSEPEPSGG